MPEFFSVGSIILDDIVFPDGETRMGVLGGGAVHAAMGMRVWSELVGLAAPLGANFPKPDLRELEKKFVINGVQYNSVQTPRAWQVYEENGHRTEVFRTDFQEFLLISPVPDRLPNNYWNSRGVHLQCATPEPLYSWIKYLRKIGCELILWEPWGLYCQPENREEIYRMLPLVDIFSPDLDEASRITGHNTLENIASTLLKNGVKRLSIRMGKAGSFVADQDGCVHRIPVVPVDKIVDVTGAGNAYCGGFLVGFSITQDLVQAGRYGAVSASFALEQFGAVYSLEDIQGRSHTRIKKLD